MAPRTPGAVPSLVAALNDQPPEAQQRERNRRDGAVEVVERAISGGG
jgi:hypothetical protein